MSVGSAQGDALAEALQRVGLLAGEHQQRVALDRQVALGGDHLGRRQVGAGLGFMDVGDGDGADLEALLGEGQLLGVGLVEGLGGGQHVLGTEHVEVGLGRTQGEVLDGQLVLGVGQGRLHLALLVLDPVLPAEQGLGELHLPAVAVVAAGGILRRMKGGVVPVGVAGEVERGQKARPPLGQLLAPGLGRGAGGRQRRIVGEGLAVDLLEISRGGLARHQRRRHCYRQTSSQPFHTVLHPMCCRPAPGRAASRCCSRGNAGPPQVSLPSHAGWAEPGPGGTQYWGIDGSTCWAHWATPPARLISLEKPCRSRNIATCMLRPP